MDVKKKHSRWLQGLLPLASALLGFLGIVIVFWQLKLTPFGDHSLLFSDFGTQYVPFATYFQTMLKEHLLPLYTFAQGLGDSFIPTLAYYLISPFNLLLLLFSGAQVPVAMAWIIMLKVAAASGAMTFYLQRHTQTLSFFHVLLGPAWGLSAFVAANYYNLMWLDTLVWLPLMLCGLEALVRKGQLFGYYCFLVLVIATNYYLGFMCCLFACLYVIYFYTETHPQFRWRNFWHEQAAKTAALRFAVTSALAGGSTMILLLPTFLGMTQTAKGSLRLSDYLPWPKYGVSMLAQLGAGASTYAEHLHHGPTVFAGSLTVLLAAAFFLHPQIPQKRKVHAGWLLFSLVVSTWFQPLNTLWHMGRGPAGFPFRQAFLIILILLLVADQALLAGVKQLAHRQKLLLPVILAGAILLGTLLGQGETALARRFDPSLLTGNTFYLSTMSWQNGLIAAAFMLVCGWVLFAQFQKGWQLSLLVLMLGELCWNFQAMIRDSPFGSQSLYAKAYVKENDEASATQRLDRRFYRMVNSNYLVNDAFATNYNNYNDAFLFNFYGISGYNSTLSEHQRLFLQGLGVYSRNERRISTAGLSPIAETLLGVKYYTGLSANTAPVVTQASGYVAMGFITDAKFGRQPILPGHIQQNLENVAAGLADGSAKPYFPSLAAAKAQTVPAGKNAQHQRLYRHRFEVTLKKPGLLYLASDSKSVAYDQTRVSGKLAKPGVRAAGQPFLQTLGERAAGRYAVTVVDTQKGADTAQKMLHELAKAPYAQLVAQLKQRSFRAFISYRHFQPRFAASIAGQKGQWLYLSLPASPGWQASVNGEIVPMQKAFGAMLKVPLVAGRNKIVISYAAPGLKIGLGVSLASFGLMLICLTGNQFYERRRRHA